MAKLREERFIEKRKNLKISIRELMNANDNINNNITESSVMEMHLNEGDDKKDNNFEDENNNSKHEEN